LTGAPIADKRRDHARAPQDGGRMIAFARAAVLTILRQHGLSTADAGAIVNEDDRAALDGFLSGRTRR
jgi:hypothetical protein